MQFNIGNSIEKRPWLFVSIIIIITIILGSFIGGLKFETNFDDFTPDDPLVKANIRINEYFGENKQVLIIRAETRNNKTILEPQLLKDLEYFKNQLKNENYVTEILSFTSFVDIFCQFEFASSLENSSSDQIEICKNDLLNYEYIPFLKILDDDDENEFKDNIKPESIDIKNFQIEHIEPNLIFEIEVYDLTNFLTQLAGNPNTVNITEWFINFENAINPIPSFTLDYAISAQIAIFSEAEKPRWELGKGPIKNIRNIREILKSPSINLSYELNPYIIIKITDQQIEIPILLKYTNVTLDIEKNIIRIEIPLSELGKYGIAPKFGSFEVPAKLTNFSAGTRHNNIPEFLYILTKKFENIQKNFIDDFFSFNESTNFSNMSEINTSSFTDIGITSEFGQEWQVDDRAANTAKSPKIFYLFPSFVEELQKISLSLISKEYKETQKPKSALLIIELSEIEESYIQLKEIRKILKTIDDLDNTSANLTFEATGPGVISVEINEISADANQIIGPLIFLIIIGVLFVSFRTPSYVLTAMLALMISSIWLFGTMALLNISFNVIAVALFPVILGLGVDYSVHLFHSYRTELMKNKTPREAIRRSIDEIGTAMFLAMITTVIAFISFLSASVPPVRDFGILLALGVFYTFITSITLSAPIRYLLDRRKNPIIKKPKTSISITNIMNRLANFVICNKKKIVIGMVLISLLMAVGASQIETGFDFEQFIPGDTPSIEVQDKIVEEFPFSSQNEEYILIEGDVATVSCLRGIRITHENLEDDTYIGKNIDGTIQVTSIYTVIQEALKNNQTLQKKFNIDESTKIPGTDYEVKQFFNYLINNEEYNQSTKLVLSKNGSYYDATVIRVFLDPAFENIEGNVNDEFEIFKQELNDDIDTYGNANAIATGNLIVQLTITNSLTISQATSTGISLFLAVLVIIIAYRNPVLGIISMIPVGVSIVWILGTMYYIGYSLNILTITVTSITIGIGIDYAIHATQRFRYTADRTGDFTTSVCETISNTGGALLIAALTTTLGFGVLVFAPIPPQQQFGLILAITIIYSFLTSVLLLPIVLFIWGNRRKKQKGYIISQKKYAKKDEHFESCKCDD